MPTQFDAERWSARTGCRVFPVPYGTKIPTFHDWINTASDSSVELNFYWDGGNHNVGTVVSEHLVLVDTDGETSYLDSELTRTLTVKTPGGIHHYYSVPYPIQSSIRHFGPDIPIDILGYGHMAIGPGSKSEKGLYYILDDTPIAELPRSVLERLTRWTPPTERGSRVSDVESPADVLAFTNVIHAWPEAIEGVHGDDLTYKLAAKSCDFGLEEETVFDLMWEHYNPRCVPPWPEDQFRQKVHNGCEYGRSKGHLSTGNQFGGVVVIPQTGMNGYAVNGSVAPPSILPPPDQANYIRAELDALTYQETPLADMEPREWIVPGYLAGGVLTQLSGKESSGKSMAVVTTQVFLACGGVFGPWDFGKGGVGSVVFAYEDDKQEWNMRIQAVCQYYGLSEDTVRKYATYLDASRLTMLDFMQRDGNKRFRRNDDASKAIIGYMEYNSKQVMIVDTIGAAARADINASDAMSAFVGTLKYVAAEAKVSELFTNHSIKADATKYMGSTAIGAPTRLSYNVEKVDVQNTQMVKLTHTKKNIYRQIKDYYFDEVSVNLKNAKFKDPMTVLVENTAASAVLLELADRIRGVIDSMFSRQQDGQLKQADIVARLCMEPFHMTKSPAYDWIKKAMPSGIPQVMPSGKRLVKIGSNIVNADDVQPIDVPFTPLNVPPGLEDLV